MSRIFHPLLYMLACATRQELARQVQYLKEENRVLRAKLPKRIMVAPAERGSSGSERSSGPASRS